MITAPLLRRASRLQTSLTLRTCSSAILGLSKIVVPHSTPVPKTNTCTACTFSVFSKRSVHKPRHVAHAIAGDGAAVRFEGRCPTQAHLQAAAGWLKGTGLGTCRFVWGPFWLVLRGFLEATLLGWRGGNLDALPFAAVLGSACPILPEDPGGYP